MRIRFAEPVEPSVNVSRRQVCRLLLGSSLLLPSWQVWGGSAAEQKRPFIMGVDMEPDTYVWRLAHLLYTEAFRRLGIPWEMLSYPLARRSTLIEQGTIDGEGGRIFAYGAQHPELVRVEEPFLDFTFSIFTANPRLQASRLEDIPATASVEYRRGILMCENVLKKVLPAERLADVTNTEQGVRKVQAGRVDLYCDIDSYVNDVLRMPEFKSGSGMLPIRKLFDIASVPTYPYLAKKHAALAPRMATVLKQMRAEGIFTAYRKRLDQQLNSR